MNNNLIASYLNMGLRAFLTAVLLSGIGLGLIPTGFAAAPPAPSVEEAPGPKRFTFADVNRRADTLATQSYAPEDAPLPDVLRDLKYDEYRDIRFIGQKSLWRGEQLPFEVQFFSRGLFFRHRVQINIVDQGQVTPVLYSNDLFDFGRNKERFSNLPADLGFAGFRLLYPLHMDSRYDEVAVFLGASYFRAVGKEQQYGISARGLAIDTGLPKEEEFPLFREFWIEKPARDATEITIYALLDSKSVTGAYRFVIKPGSETVMDVKANLFMRQGMEKLGVAPLTSMFFHGELTERYMNDFRPEVHDSDGLLLALGSGEWLWRPLDNPTRLRISSFQDNNPRGFGLLQRDRDFDSYQDLESNYQDRPSTWVEPLGEWGKGVVQLIEIPTSNEHYDNVVAFWIPERRTEAGQKLDLEYRLYFFKDRKGRPPGGKALATRIGGGGMGVLEPDKRKFVIDFSGEDLAKVDPDKPPQPPEPKVNVSAGEVVKEGVSKEQPVVVQQNPDTKGWRVFFEWTPPDTGEDVELRCYLQRGADVLTETWSYKWSKQK